MGGPSLDAVDQHRGIGHHAIKINLDPLPLPGLVGFELAAVGSCLLAGCDPLLFIPSSVGIVAKALQLPVARHFDGFPAFALCSV